MRIPSDHSLGTSLSFYTECIRSSRRSIKPPCDIIAFIISGCIPDFPADLFFRLLIASNSSSTDGGVARSKWTGICSMLSITLLSKVLGMLSKVKKCLHHLLCCSCSVLHLFPCSSSIMPATIFLGPLRPCCRSLMHCHVSLPLNLPFSASSALDLNQSSFIFLRCFLVLARAFLNLSLSSSFWVVSQIWYR